MTTVATSLNSWFIFQLKILIGLAQTFESVPDLRERIERDGWFEQARELQDQKYVTTNAERPRWWSRRRLK